MSGAATFNLRLIGRRVSVRVWVDGRVYGTMHHTAADGWMQGLDGERVALGKWGLSAAEDAVCARMAQR